MEVVAREAVAKVAAAWAPCQEGKAAARAAAVMGAVRAVAG